MGRGRLRVMLGAAPGVGKTFAMLEEGHRLAAAGKDVVVAVVETHGRVGTGAQLDGLTVIPRRRVNHLGVALEEMDLDAVLARRPDVALVDELAHSNAPGSRNDKRWRDVDELLDAGIDVLSTVNIQHIESLNDVVLQITGVPQRETIPDAALRAADQIELVDLAPQALRDRLAEGVVYPPARVDAALSNYFRLGNLTALRELALLWLADEVDVALQAYRSEKGIAAPWEARERIVVALTGGPEGETLLRRGARIAARTSGGQLFAVHVSSADGLAESDPAALQAQRSLVETLGGSYHHVVAEQIPVALVDFARGVNATQLVIGVSRRTRLESILGGAGIGASVIRLAADIDVHIVSHSQAGKRRLPAIGGALSLRRRVLGLVLTIAGLPLLTLLLAAVRSPQAVPADVLSYQLFIVVIAVVGGIWPALFAAVAAGFCLDFFFVPPLYAIRISQPSHFLALVIFLVVAAIVSVVVDQAARRSRAATRSAAEAEVLATVASGVISGSDAIEALVTRLREAFGMQRVELVDDGQLVFAADEDDAPADAGVGVTELPVGEGARIILTGKPLAASDRRILAAFIAQLESALDRRRLASEAAEMRPLAAADRLRSALLAAVGHDLRRPLAAATAAVTSLRSRQIELSPSDREELLETADDSLRALSGLVTDLLDVSRLQAGVIGVTLEPVHLDDVVGDALEELRLAPGAVALELGDTRPAVADATLLLRVLVNLLANAIRFAPAGTAPIISTSEFAGRVQLRVIDAGPGIPADRREEVFLPFQRLGDTDNTAGVGLGLALSKGFVEGMGGTLETEDTPGGGLTMVVELEAAP
ncbi:ATP-binding protein [Galbitalea soli]|uniref:histidine kinase n=1 Tax=Galbitalea soli TaxID=1268042 RepID=A0A7C9TPL0_9MICO|nr:ATP-binding protein [Galbitalea soli]NEM90301.1 sensor histidine kinase KdpD [Galbitalea soli]NYJ31009.1 two-component system sensor histidine kinase KdpD [Galbitalea soli]